MWGSVCCASEFHARLRVRSAIAPVRGLRGPALALGIFSAFWTALALRLAQPPFSLGMRGVAVFALAGASGAIEAPPHAQRRPRYRAAGSYQFVSRSGVAVILWIDRSAP